MNRFIQSILFVFILTFSAFGQERDTVTLSQDTLGQYQYYDSIFRARNPELWATRTRELDSLRSDSLLADTLYASEPLEVRSPSKAIMFSLVLPGLGQAYNRKFWKMPIVWAALGGAGYAIVFNSNNYRQASYDYAQNPDDLNQQYLEYWRRNMELSYIVALAVYALQVLDAYVDAQLYSWDVNDNLSIGVSPSLKPLLVPSSITGYAYGLGCSFNIRGR